MKAQLDSLHVPLSSAMSPTHALVLGDDVLEERAVDDGAVPLLHQVQPVDGAHLQVVGLVLGVHLRATHRTKNKAHSPPASTQRGKICICTHRALQHSRGRQGYLEMLPTCLNLTTPSPLWHSRNSECDSFQSCTLGAHFHPSWKHH